MQLAIEFGDPDEAIRELERALPVAALMRVIEFRERCHRPRASLRRRLELLRAEQLRQEA